MRFFAIVLTAPFSARTARECGYMILTLVPAIVVFPLAIVGIVASALSVVGIGLPILIVILGMARLAGGVFAAPARLLLGWRWESRPPLAGSGPGRIPALLGDAVAWRGLLYSLVKLPLTVVAVAFGAIGVVVGGLGLTSPLWWPVVGSAFGPFDIDRWSSTPGLALQGGVVFFATPWFIRAMVALDRRLCFTLLAPDPSRSRIVALESGRETLEADATAKLRRIERNLHDGTQARFVLLGLALSQLKDRTVDAESRSMITSAQQIIRDGMEELREVIRGMRPPILDDSLTNALTSLTSTNPVPTTLVDDLVTRPPDATATALYFAAAELLSNLVRHADATGAELRLDETPSTFQLTVRDNGSGGAGGSTSGTGLDGLRRRAQALDGSMLIDSPAGGPTLIVINLPKE